MSGKWDNPKIPHSGWICTGFDDLGYYPAMTCQMCEKEDIRYAHYMKHPAYKGCLVVGMMCAAKMEGGSIENAKEREAFMKSRVGKRKNWLDRKWKISKNGNQYVKTDGFVVVMKRNKDGLWSAFVKSENGDYEKWSKERNRNEKEMKLAAFDCLTNVLKERTFNVLDDDNKKIMELPARAEEIIVSPIEEIREETINTTVIEKPLPIVANISEKLPRSLPMPVINNQSAVQTNLFGDIFENVAPIISAPITSTQVTNVAHTFTAEQQYIFDFVKNGTGHGIIDAVAGAGKTTTIMECAKYAENQSEILFCAFNKSIQSEIASKFSKRGMNQVTVKTIHALGFQMLKDNNNSGKKLAPQEHKYKTILNKDQKLQNELQTYTEKLLRINGYKLNETESDRWFAAKDFIYKFRERLLDMNQKIRATLTPSNLARFREMVEHFNFFTEAEAADKSFDKTVEIYFECSMILLDAGNALAKESMIIDFTDMLYLPFIWDLRASRGYSFLFIDECQDLSKSQLAVVLKYGKKDSRILAVGDPYQSIYGFAGADIESFSRIKKTIKAKELPLTTCFRCPPNVVEMAAAIRSDITANKREDGKIEEITFKRVVKTAKADDLVISRYREPILFLAFEFINKNIQVQIHKDEVNEIIDELKRLFKPEERAATISEIPGDFEELKRIVYNRWHYIIEQDARKLPNPSEQQIYIKTRTEYLKNKLEFMHKKYLLWKISCPTVNDMLVRIKDFISATENCVKLSTIHRAKGLEANTVFILNYEDLPHFTPNQKPWERVQEQNLKYVAITRALKELYLVKSQKRGDMKKEASLFDEFSLEI